MAQLNDLIVNGNARFLNTINGNVATATKLQTSRTIFNKSFDGTADIAGQPLVYGTYNASPSGRYATAGIQVRENGLVASAQSDIAYAPAIGFHWGGRIAASMLFHSDGNFYLRKQNFTDRATLDANIIGSVTGNADTATKLGTSTVGGTTTPIYLNAGTPTALSYTIAKSVPASAIFTDNYVNRTDSTADSALRVLLTTEADDANTTGTARKSSKLTFNPSTGNLQATQLNGVTIGSSPKFTDTTYNFSGSTFYSGSNGVAEHNCNNATTNGTYYYTSNGPATTEGASTADGALYVQGHSASWVGQIAQDYRNGKLQVRGKNSGTWYPWLPVMTFEDTFGLLYTATKFKFNGLTRKIQANKSTSAWDSQVYSSQGYASNCVVTFKPSQTNMAIMIGLDANPTEDANYTKIDYCWYIQNDGKLNIYESGSPKLTAYAYAAGDDLRIEYDGINIRYLHNGVIKRTVARAISGKLYMDSSFHGASGAVYDFDFSMMPNNTAISALSNSVYGIYTGSGGAQGPSYYGKNRAGFIMSNESVAGDVCYKNWLYMDNYNGDDAGGATAIGVDRIEPRLFIMQSDKNRTSWNNKKAVGVFTTDPSADQLIITDGTTGGMKTIDLCLQYITPFWKPTSSTSNTCTMTFGHLGANESISIILFGRYGCWCIRAQTDSSRFTSIAYSKLESGSNTLSITGTASSYAMTITGVGNWSALTGLFFHAGFPGATIAMS